MLHDPHLAFNVTAMRGHDKFRQVLFDRVAQAASQGDDFGMNRIYHSLRLLYSEV